MKRTLATLLVPVVLLAASGTAFAQAAPVQCGDFMKLRDEAQHRAAAVRNATQHKVERKEVCTLMIHFTASEEEVIKFLEKNKTWCNVPDVAITTAKASHEQSMKFRKIACTEAPIAQPKQPTLSDAIGQTSIDTGGNTRTGRGTLDSLSGNPLAK
jgi:hypothetical protein